MNSRKYCNIFKSCERDEKERKRERIEKRKKIIILLE